MKTLSGLIWIVVLVFLAFVILSVSTIPSKVPIIILVFLAGAFSALVVIAKGIKRAGERRKQRKEEKERAAFNKQILNALSVPYTPSRESAPVNNAPALIPADQFVKNLFDCYVAFDLETTGLSPQHDEIIEFGAVRVENGEISREFSRLVKPTAPIPAEASRVNHITDDMVKNADPIHVVLREFLHFCEGVPVLAGHNVKFDADFVLAAADREGIEISAQFFDTLDLTRKVWPQLPNKKLATVCQQINYTITDAHRALADAKAVHAIMQAAPEAENNRREENKFRREQEKRSAAEKVKISQADREKFAERCALPDIKNYGDWEAGYQAGHKYYKQGDIMKAVGDDESALILYHKARYMGYDAPALYEALAITYRKKKDYQSEIEVIDEFLSRNTYGKGPKFAARREKAVELLNKQQERQK